MPRIRNLTVAGVLAGATVLGGAGLAGATDADTDTKELDQTSTIETLQASDDTQDTTTGESDETPTPPSLPDAASDRATTAIAEAPAFAEAAEAEPDDAKQPELEAAPAPDPDESADAAPEAKPDNHGQDVSQVARETPPGPEHGKTVSEAAKQNGQGGEDDPAEGTSED